MKKRIFIVISCLLIVFSFIKNVNAQTVFRSNPYEFEEFGYQECVNNGYSARQCIEKCSTRSFNLSFSWKEIGLNLQEQNIAYLYSSDPDDDSVEGYFFSAEPHDGVNFGDNISNIDCEALKEKEDPMAFLDSTLGSIGDKAVYPTALHCGIINSFTTWYNYWGHDPTWKEGIVRGKKNKVIRWHEFGGKDEYGRKYYLKCVNDDGSYDFECDMSGNGNDFVLYMSDNKTSNNYKKIGTIRKFTSLYDPNHKTGWLDAVLDKIADYGKDQGDSFSSKIAVCLDKNSSNLNAILDMDSEKSFFKNSKHKVEGLDKTGCVYLGAITFKKEYNEEVKPVAGGGSQCFSFLHKETSFKPFYNTTVWTDKNIAGRCGFVDQNWNKDECKDSDLHQLYITQYGRTVKSRDDCSKAERYDSNLKKCYRDISITKSGYNGVADFYEVYTNQDELDVQCENFQGLHIIYRVIIVAAPILVILFVSFDLVRTIIAGDEKQMSKFRSSLVKRIVALILLILIPVIVRVLVSTLTSKSKYDNAYKPNLIRCMVIGNDK